MQNQIVLPTKRRADIHSVIAPFDQLLQPGEIIESGTLDIYVFSGTDLAPEDMLDGSIFIEGTTLRHRIKLGVPGVTYQLVFLATTNLDNTYEVECRQVVLPDDMPVEPVFQQYYFTSTPYPVESIEAVIIAQSFPDALLWRPPLDGVDITFEPIDGNLRNLLITYDNYPPEGVDISFEPTEGNLRNILITYDNYPPEGVDISMEPREGTLRDLLITYSNYPPEGVDISFSPQAGTLV